MEIRPELAVRDRALRLVRMSTTTAILGALGLTGAFSTAAAMTFSGKPPVHHDAPPVLPARAAPAQVAPPAPIVITQYVTVPYGTYTATTATSAGASAPAAPGAAAPPPPPPPPACVSTPSKPC
jgi:hypothetical protein